MNDEMKTMDTTNLFYAGLKSKEKELLAQLHELKEEIANAEKDIINEKFDIAIQCLIDIEEMTNGYYSDRTGKTFRQEDHRYSQTLCG